MRHRLVLSFAALAALLWLAPTSVSAQPLGDFNVIRFSPAPGANNYASVDGARVHGALAGSAGLMLDFAYRPFQLYEAICANPDGTDCQIEPGTSPTDVVEYTAAAHLFGSIALFDRLQISIVAPLAIARGDAFTFGRGAMGMLPGGPDPQFVLSDPRLHVKFNAIDDRSSGFRLAVVAYVTAPTGHAIAPGRHLGDEDPTVGGHIVAELVTSGFHVAANVGGLWRDGDTLFSTEAVGQFTYAVAVGYEITPMIDVFGELVGATSFRAAVDENPMEARLAARLRVDDVSFTLAGGPGIVAGLGTPAFRILGGFLWAPIVVDEDGDGINDELDSCPADAEDIDDHDDVDGCPDPDNDGDSLPDVDDTCPNEAEDMDGVEDTDGCPDEDTDGDGIQDGYDSCVNEAEDMDDDRDDDGCPDFDRDRDNINDDVDACPGEPEDTDGFGDEDGCPETDFDGDTLSDEGDECPDVAEDLDGFEDADGCPEDGPFHSRPHDADGDGVRDDDDNCAAILEDIDGFEDHDGCPDPDNDGDGVTDIEDHCRDEAGIPAEHGCPQRVELDLAHGSIMLLAQVEFETRSDVILERSIPIMEQLLEVLVGHPELTRVRIDGFTDDRGRDSQNLDLSRRRAASVRRWLLDHGVAAERLEAWGCGELHPIGDNTTDAGRQANRRVTFTILEPLAEGVTPWGDCTAE